jgi:hypothetical protein
MNRKTLIIYCDDTQSGKLQGPSHDNSNFRRFLKSNLGGAWYDDEIISLNNPSSYEVASCLRIHFKYIDYSFIIFSGHGCINVDQNKIQFLELSDTDVSIFALRNDSPRQTLIVDSCRGYFSQLEKSIEKALVDSYRAFSGDIQTTRKIYENAIENAEEGWSILYSADENQSALDTSEGGAYLLSLLRVSDKWNGNTSNQILPLNLLHDAAKVYLKQNFQTIQNPTMTQEKRLRYFPFAVKVRTLIS